MKMNNRKMLLATGNPHKVVEMERILSPYGVEISLPPKELLDSIVEDGETFSENALIKARTIFNGTGLPTIADDSGLCVDAIDGRPGVYSARYLGEETQYPEKMQGIINELQDVPEEKRGATFQCAVAVVTAKGEYVFQGECVGKIGYAPQGDRGFGYDPIFMVGDRSYSQLSDGEKDKISHRGRALEKLIKNINNIEF